MAKEIEQRYTLKSKKLIPDEKDDLINTIEEMMLYRQSGGSMIKY